MEGMPDDGEQAGGNRGGPMEASFWYGFNRFSPRADNHTHPSRFETLAGSS